MHGPAIRMGFSARDRLRAARRAIPVNSSFFLSLSSWPSFDSKDRQHWTGLDMHDILSTPPPLSDFLPPSHFPYESPLAQENVLDDVRAKKTQKAEGLHRRDWLLATVDGRMEWRQMQPASVRKGRSWSSGMGGWDWTGRAWTGGFR